MQVQGCRFLTFVTGGFQNQSGPDLTLPKLLWDSLLESKLATPISTGRVGKYCDANGYGRMSEGQMDNL